MRKMTTSLVAAVSLIAFAGCDKKKEEGTVQKPLEGPAVTPSPPKAEPEKPLVGTALADKYRACTGLISAGTLDQFQKDCYDPSFVSHDRGDGSDRKATEVNEWFKAMKVAMPDMKIEPQLIMVNGRNVLAVSLMTGTQSGVLKLPPTPEVPATNKKIGMLMFHRIAISEANRATEEWTYPDPGTMMGQLGLLPKGAPTTRPALDKGWDGAPVVVVTADDAKEKANLELVKKEVDAVNNRKWADVMAMYASDATEIDLAAPGDTKGVKEIEKAAKMWFDAFPDAKVNMDSSWAGGDYVIATGTFTGTNTKDLGPMKKTGKQVNLGYAEVFHIKDGKIATLWRFHSSLTLAMQLGLMPAPGTPAAGSAAPTAPAAGSAAPAAPAGSAAPAAPAAGSAAPAPKQP